MSVLSDYSLRQIYPDSQPGPASIDLHLGDTLLWWPDNVLRDPRRDQSGIWESAPLLEDAEGPYWILVPGIRFRAATRERIEIRPDCAGQISARSSWGRDGLAVICGPAGFLDPGFRGNVTLELSVVGSELILWPGASVCQLIVHRLTSPCERPYSGRYQDADGSEPSKTHLEATR